MNVIVQVVNPTCFKVFLPTREAAEGRPKHRFDRAMAIETSFVVEKWHAAPAITI